MPGGSQVMLVVPEQVVQEAGDILASTALWSVIQTQTLTGLNCFIISEFSALTVQLGVLMRENIIYRDEDCDRILFPGLAASSQGPTRMLS